MIRSAITRALLFIAAVAFGADERAGKLDKLFRDLHARDFFHGAVVVSDADTEVYAAGFGLANREEGVAFTPDTPTDAASLAKTFTAAAVWRLIEEGRLRANDRVQRHLPSFPYPEITIAHLLAHSSGLPDYDFFERVWPRGSEWSNERILATLAERRPPLIAAPDTAFNYNNPGYDLAAQVVAAVARREFATVLREGFFRPLEMSEAFVRPARFAEWSGVRTRGYRLAQGEWRLNDAEDNEGVVGAANVYLSMRDLQRWNTSFWERPVLAPDALEAGLLPAKIDGHLSGLNWLSWYSSVDGSAHWYAGEHRGFSTRAYRDTPKRRSIVFTANNTPPQWLIPALLRAINAVLDGAAPEPLIAPAVKRLSPEEFAAVAGDYELEQGTVIRLQARDDALTVSDPGGLEYRAYPTGGGIFYVPGRDTWFWFTADWRLIWSRVTEQDRAKVPDTRGGG